MKKVVLISCSSQKVGFKTQARNLYSSPLFKLSLEYAEKLNPDEIFILSAEHHLVKLDTELEPYDVTLSYVSPKEKKKKSNLRVLTKKEKDDWGKEVLNQLSKYVDFVKDEIILLAGNEYYKPLSEKISENSMYLTGRIGERLQFLKRELNK